MIYIFERIISLFENNCVILHRKQELLYNYNQIRK